VLFHTFYGFFANAFPHSPVTELGARVGRTPAELWAAADALIVASDPELDPAGPSAPAGVRWTGVVQPRVAPAPRTDRSHVLLSLSTCWFPGQQEAMQQILDALGGLPVRVTATIGGSIAVAPLRVPANVEVRGFVAHTEVMPTVSFVIGHGGHATTMLALAHDLPLLIVPQLIDQPMFGQILTDAGAGLMVAQEGTVEELRTAITALLEDDSYGRAAARIGTRLRAQDGAVRAADRVESLAGIGVSA
jgi:MGT family glycosyltransferase